MFRLQAGLPVLLAVLCGRLAILLPRGAGQFHLLGAVGRIGVLPLVGITAIEMALAHSVSALPVIANGPPWRVRPRVSPSPPGPGRLEATFDNAWR
ncbi:hypothetical protein [Streptomyces violaceusniger]|uniref:hypothetical protein n=1 Tax=Streptomyces violaceusniger TaxID=68280 RepID=UPI0005B7DB67|nr:hypothetical protein [Streptomyces violaceusniger]